VAADAYPRALERDVVLPGGERVRLRPIRPDDAPHLVSLYARLSEHSAYQRFFTVLKRLPPDWVRFFANVDYVRRLALVAEVMVDGRPALVGVGRYEAEGSDVPEVAFVVEDAWQGRGLGSILLQDVVRAAVARGYGRFRAYVLADNRRMLDLLGRFTHVVETRLEGPVKEVLFTPRAGEAA
jgi:RimJ/RimL family protein N-acetyltransferase